jgi:hypothetical protein
VSRSKFWNTVGDGLVTAGRVDMVVAVGAVSVAFLVVAEGSAAKAVVVIGLNSVAELQQILSTHDHDTFVQKCFFDLSFLIKYCSLVFEVSPIKGW